MAEKSSSLKNQCKNRKIYGSDIFMFIEINKTKKGHLPGK
jgi:hypothetical protein